MIRLARLVLRVLDRLGVSRLAFRLLDRPVRWPRLTVPIYWSGMPAGLEGRSLVGDAAVWDDLRERHEGFAIPDSRDAWERLAREDRERPAAAAAIAGVARRLGAARLCSYGSGTGTLELLIHLEAPDLEIVCTDVTPRTLARLRRLFPEAEVVEHDLAHDPPLEADLHLLYRVDTEFPDEELDTILAGFREPVLFVPHDLLRWARIRQQIRAGRDERASLVGWARSERTLRRLLGDRAIERVVVGDLEGFLAR